MSKTNQTGPQPVVKPAPQSVISTLQEAYLGFAVGARDQWAAASRMLAEKKRKLEEIALLQGEVEHLTTAIQLSEHRGRELQLKADDHGHTIASMGAEVPPLPPERPQGQTASTSGHEPQPIEAEAHRQVWNGQAPPQTGVWAHPAGDTGQQSSVWDKPLDPQQEARLDRLAALKDADPNPDPEL